MLPSPDSRKARKTRADLVGVLRKAAEGETAEVHECPTRDSFLGTRDALCGQFLETGGAEQCDYVSGHAQHAGLLNSLVPQREGRPVLGRHGLDEHRVICRDRPEEQPDHPFL